MISTNWFPLMRFFANSALVVEFVLKTVAFSVGKKNPADQNFYIRFSIEIKLKK